VDARKRMLDFYDSSAGSSLLKPAERATRKRIASHIQVIARILKMTHAGLGDDALADLGATLHAEVIDFGSNAFSWEGLRRMGICRWLGLAANGLKQMPLSNCLGANSICKKMIFMSLQRCQWKWHN
jgi:hypothetical protein